MRKNPQIYWSVLFIVVFIIIFFLFTNKQEFISNVSNIRIEEKAESLLFTEGQSVESGLMAAKFKHEILGYSFEYPKKYKINSFGNFYDANGETVILQNTDSDFLQILVTPFDEDISLTVDRIKKDVPTLNINNGKEGKIGGDNGVQLVMFESDNSLTTGKSLEAWFVYNKNLYQISSSLNSKELYNEVIKTWKLD